MNPLLDFQFDPKKVIASAEQEDGQSVSVGGLYVRQRRLADLKRLKQIRKGLGAKQKVFAKMLKVRASTLRAWETGKRSVSGPATILYELIEADPAPWRERCKQLADS